MKKIVASLVTLSLVFSGCTLFTKDPLATANSSVAKLADVKKSSLVLRVDGTVQTPATAPTSGTQTLKFSIDASGQSDSTDLASPKFDMNMAMGFTMDDKTGSGEVELRAVNQKMFVNLKKIDLGKATAALGPDFTALFNKWWTLPSDAKSNPFFGQSADDQKKIKDLLKNTKFFSTATEETAKEDVHGVASTKYRVDVDKDAIKKFIVAIGGIAGNKVSPDEESSIADSLKDVEFSGAVWVGDDDGMIHRVKGTVTIQPKDGPTSSFDIDYSAWDYGKDVAIGEPASPEEFNVMMLMPLIGAFQDLQTAPTAPPTPAAPGTTPAPVTTPKTK